MESLQIRVRNLAHVAIKQCPLVVVVLCVAVFGLAGCSQSEPGQMGGSFQSKRQKDFRWSGGKRAAVSLSFDDARLSQVDNGLAILDKYGVKATFYVIPGSVKRRLAGWQRAVASGHEIGNHSLRHPCTGNFSWARKKALEEYSLEMMERELDEANTEIERLLGVRPTTFAYPCGQKFVGRGRAVKSYVPLVAERFVVGRGYNEEVMNDPAFCDLAQVMSAGIDGLDFEQIKGLVERAAADGRWLILCGHEIGRPGSQATRASALEAFCEYAQDPANGLWVDTVEAVGRYILEQRNGQIN